ncbi:uncharacterized protein M6G45_015700 [Spheniscus humboldti]
MGQANCCCGSREALSDAEAVLSTDVRLTRGRKRSERRLLLLEEELVIAKLQHGGTTPRPQLCLALDQLWVVSGGKEAAGEEEEQEEEGSNEDRTSIILIWPTGSYGPSQFPLGSECWSVGANSQQREQDGAVLAQSSAGRRQGLAEQRCPGTGISTPLPILAVAGWAASLVHGEGPPVPGRMGQANCCCGSREALSDAEAVLSTDVRLTRGRKRSERRLLLLEEELVIAKLQHGGTTPRPQLCLALDQLWVVSGGKEAAGEEEEQEEEGSNEDRTSIILIWPTGSYEMQVSILRVLAETKRV